MNQRQDRPVPTYVYGVFAIPGCMIESREVESVWTDEERATDRARMRSIQVTGKVCVVQWQVNMTGSRRVLRAFRDGEPIRKGMSVAAGPDLLE